MDTRENVRIERIELSIRQIDLGRRRTDSNNDVKLFDWVLASLGNIFANRRGKYELAGGSINEYTDYLAWWPCRGYMGLKRVGRFDCFKFID